MLSCRRWAPPRPIRLLPSARCDERDGGSATSLATSRAASGLTLRGVIVAVLLPLDSPLFDEFPFILLGPMSESPPFVWSRVFYLPVHLKPFMSLWQIFGDRRTAFIAEQESMAILPDLELPARTCPLTGFGRFCFAFRVKLARTHRTPYFFNVHGESFNKDLGDVCVWVAKSPRFFTELVDKLLHFIERLPFRHIHSS
jgi:hypothetical protein